MKFKKTGKNVRTKVFRRKYPLFSLCGLNCGLCPRYQTEGQSKCPGCGGPDFHLKHPTCAVVTCNKKQDQVEFCFECSSYPCDKYKKPGNADSFISYKNVSADFDAVKKQGIDKYMMDLKKKMKIFEYLNRNFNDGRKKGYYCLAVNLLKLGDLESIIKIIEKQISVQNTDLKSKIRRIVDLFESKAKEAGVEIKLRKNSLE